MDRCAVATSSVRSSTTTIASPRKGGTVFTKLFESTGDTTKNVKDGLSRLQGESLAAQHTTAVQQATLEQLADLTLEKFWLQDSRVINQMLHRIMGNRRFVILNKEVIGVAISRRTQRRRTWQATNRACQVLSGLDLH